MKKALTLLSALCLCFSAAGCAQNPAPAKPSEEPGMTAGTYTAKANGMDGEITIAVTVSETAIEKIEIVDDNETAGVGDRALRLIADQVTASQSLGVDNVAGATISSAAMKKALEDALTQAGGEVAAWQNKPVVSAEVQDEYDYDVVVVGSGIAGLSAAAAAQKDGAKVAVLEKLGIPGGTSIFSSGAFLATGSADGVEAMAKTWIAKNKIQDRNAVDEELIGAMAQVSPDVIAMMEETGTEFSMMKEIYFFPKASEKAIKNASAIQLASATPTQKGGQALINGMEDYLMNAGVDFYMNTPATSLVLDENGQVTGVRSESSSKTRTFNAKAIILATGDYAQNAEMTQQLCPDAAHNYTATAIGNTGDGITMALEAGAVLDEFQESMSGIFAPDPYAMPVVGQPNNSYPYECLLLNAEGQRPISETAGTHDQMIYFIVEGEPDYGWVIMDQEIADQFLNLDEYLAKTAENNPVIQAYKADSIEALAAQMGMEVSTLQASIDRYNQMCAAKEDTDCGKEAEYLSPIDDGTYYAVKEYDLTRGNYGGIVTNDKAEVVNAQGQAIAGLYAAGILSSGAFFGDYYPGGEALGVGAYMGYIAGRQAAQTAAE